MGENAELIVPAVTPAALVTCPAALRMLGLAGLLALAPCANAGRAYVSNEDGQTVTVIDTDKAEAIATVAVGKRPRGLKLSKDGSQLYVAVSGLPKCPPTIPDAECAKFERDLSADGIAVIDTASLKMVKVLKAGSDPEQFDLSTDGRLLFVANEDAAQTSVLRSVVVGHRPRDVAFTPDSRVAYVSGEFDASLYRMSVPDGAPVERLLELRKEARPMAVVLDPARGRLYLSTGRGGTVAVVALAEPKLVTEIPVGTRPWGMALSTDGKRLYTANGPSNDVSVIDTTSLQVIKKIPVGRSPWGVALGPAPPVGGG